VVRRDGLRGPRVSKITKSRSYLVEQRKSLRRFVPSCGVVFVAFVVRREGLRGPRVRKSRSHEAVSDVFKEKEKPSAFRAFVCRRLRGLRGAARRAEGAAGFEDHEVPKLSC